MSKVALVTGASSGMGHEAAILLAKFIRRYGLAAHRWVNSEIGRRHRLRGINTRVVKPGTIRVGDRVKKAHGDTGGVCSSDEAYTALS